MKIRLVSTLSDYLRDSEEIVRAFSPYIELTDDAADYIELTAELTDNEFLGKITSSFGEEKKVFCDIRDMDMLVRKRISKRIYKNALYEYISDYLQVKLPYGSLTGVRPTKLLYELGEENKQTLIKDFFVAPKKADLLQDVLHTQRGIYQKDPQSIDLYINIPFCPTRCAYCSFISTEYKRIEKRIGEYVTAVKKELASAFDLIDKKGYKLRSIYVGGGTPTALDAQNLREILCELKNKASEFTVEAGRPDTIDEEKAEVLRSLGVTRVSVNPQTFSDETLLRIGRKHTVADFYSAYELLKNKGFTLNVDLIAGLDGESADIFYHSVDNALGLSPDNITIHSLSLKRGSKIVERGDTKKEFGLVGQMLDYAHFVLKNAGYAPYYLYRQKNCSDNLENTGYAKPGKECVYNVDIMEDTTSIIGVGAGAMSKKVNCVKGLIDRFSSPKGFEYYVERIDETIKGKREFFVNEPKA